MRAYVLEYLSKFQIPSILYQQIFLSFLMPIAFNKNLSLNRNKNSIFYMTEITSLLSKLSPSGESSPPTLVRVTLSPRKVVASIKVNNGNVALLEPL